MSLHYGFSHSEHDDADSGPYKCSDPDCDNGVDCKGEHNYSEEIIRLRWGKHDLSESVNKSENTVDKSLEKSVSSVDKPMHATLTHDVVVDEPPLVPSLCPDLHDLPDDGEYVSDSEDVSSCC